MRALVVCYSLTGTTGRVARALADALGAELEEIRCPRYRPGLLGSLRAGHDSWRNRIPEIEAPAHDPAQYGLVVVGGPVWAWNACTPVRAYLTRTAARLPAVAFFATAGGAGFERAFATMQALAGKKPAATLALAAEHFKQGKDPAAIAAFAAELRRGGPG